jgi:antitoxin CptB
MGSSPGVSAGMEPISFLVSGAPVALYPNRMAEMEEIGDPLQVRRKRLRYRSWHRGTREADLLLGRFADVHLAGMDEAQLARFAALLDVPDPDLVDWLTGRQPRPAGHDNDVAALLCRFTAAAARIA